MWEEGDSRMKTSSCSAQPLKKDNVLPPNFAAKHH